MKGIYSTNINDVLKISKNYDGIPIETRDNSIYLKHTVNSKGIITKTESCFVKEWGTLCIDNSGVYHDDAKNEYIDPNYETKVNLLSNYWGYDLSNSTSRYAGYACSNDYEYYFSCHSSQEYAYLVHSGYFYVSDENNIVCPIDNSKTSHCAELHLS